MKIITSSTLSQSREFALMLGLALTFLLLFPFYVYLSLTFNLLYLKKIIFPGLVLLSSELIFHGLKTRAHRIIIVILPLIALIYSLVHSPLYYFLDSKFFTFQEIHSLKVLAQLRN